MCQSRLTYASLPHLPRIAFNQHYGGRHMSSARTPRKRAKFTPVMVGCIQSTITSGCGLSRKCEARGWCRYLSLPLHACGVRKIRAHEVAPPEQLCPEYARVRRAPSFEGARSDSRQ